MDPAAGTSNHCLSVDLYVDLFSFVVNISLDGSCFLCPGNLIIDGIFLEFRGDNCLHGDDGWFFVSWGFFFVFLRRLCVCFILQIL